MTGFLDRALDLAVIPGLFPNRVRARGLDWEDAFRRTLSRRAALAQQRCRTNPHAAGFGCRSPSELRSSPGPYLGLGKTAAKLPAGEGEGVLAR